eukprot:3353160-Pyramimonas_sp.AAC.1
MHAMIRYFAAAALAQAMTNFAQLFGALHRALAIIQSDIHVPYTATHDDVFVVHTDEWSNSPRLVPEPAMETWMAHSENKRRPTH